MSATTATLRGQRAAAALMVDTADVTRPGAATFDPNTGLSTPSSTFVLSAPCRLRQPTSQESEVLFGEEQLTRTRFIACFPHDTVGIAVDDIVTFTASEDPDVLARRFRITGVPLSTFTLYKGYPVEVVE